MNTADQFEVVKHTQGPWRVEKSGGVVSDAPIDGGVPGTADVDFYGGHLICETVTSANARLIAAAPELLAELGKADLIINVMLNRLTPAQKRICAEMIEDLRIHGQGMTRANERDALLRKATGIPA